MDGRTTPIAASIAALRAEGDALDALVSELPARGWRLPTPAVGWTIAHQIGHLHWTDEVALLALSDADAFAEVVRAAARAPLTVSDEAAAARAQEEPSLLLRAWREGREALATALAAVPAGERVAWFGPSMSPRSMVTARLMETWAHGQDVADALGVTRTPTDRLREVCELGVRTRDFAFRLNGLEPPAEAFRLELLAPDGTTWVWGPQEARDIVTGTAEAFCLVVTQRRELASVDLTPEGEQAVRWLDIAQAFAGAPKAVTRAALAEREDRG